MVTLPWPFVVDPAEKERGDNSNLSFLTAKPHGLRDALTWMGYPRFSGVVPRVSPYWTLSRCLGAYCTWASSLLLERNLIYRPAVIRPGDILQSGG